MHPRQATATMTARPEAAAIQGGGRRLALARAAWAVLVALALGLFVAALPAQYAAHTAPPPATQAALARLTAVFSTSRSNR